MILDYTTMSDFLSCRMYWYWRHKRNLVSMKENLPAEFGIALHLGFKAVHTEGNPIEIFKKAYQSINIPVNEKRTVEHGVTILKKYMEQYATNPFEIIECNGSHLMRISDTIIYAARMDAVVRYLVTGGVYVMDHKTTSKLGYRFFDNFQLNLQVNGYIPACKDKFGECQGAVIDAISTKQEVLTNADVEAWLAKGRNRFLKKKKTTSFLRDFATRTIDQQKNFTKEVVDIADNIQYAIEKDSYPKNYNACNNYGACPYKALCLHGEGAMDMYEVSVWDAKTGKEIRDEKTRTE